MKRRPARARNNRERAKALYAPAREWAEDTLRNAGLPTDPFDESLDKDFRVRADGTIVDDLPTGDPSELERLFPEGVRTVNATLHGLAEMRFGRDSPEHLAARIIWQLQCLDASLRQRHVIRSLADASMIGELVGRVNLDPDINAGIKLNRREMQSKGGRASKKKKGIWDAVRNLVRNNPAITIKKAWLSFPDDMDCPGVPEGSFSIYRDGEKLVQFDREKRREKELTYRTFQRYVSDAKKEIRH